MGWFDHDDPQEKLIRLVTKALAREFPEYAHSRPRLSERSDGTFLLVYECVYKTEDGAKLTSRLRVVADADGKILKTSVSR